MVVDDDENIVEVVSRALQRQGHAITAAYDGTEAVELLQRQKPDLVILDIIMPHMNGLKVCQYMRRNPTLASVPIIFLTVRERVEDKLVGLEAGADDYLSKPFSIAELELRVKALLRRAAPVKPTGVLAAGPLSLDPDRGRAMLNGRLVELTPVEFQLLYYMISHVGEVIPTERLLQEVWGYPPGIGSASLVRMHVLNLRRKLEKDPRRPTYLCTVPRHGYTLQFP
jgi:DNA-binding response OmpR family regulator